tara:strand:- start:1748 stop:2155 length:408 start_codon:yes stop_codon:yes gene_type:complete
MKFTITKLTTNSVDVQFDNGSIATVPLQKGQTKDEIIYLVTQFNNPDIPFDKVEDIPVKVGDELEELTSEDPEVSYMQARDFHYPAVGKQLDALYWARQGDDTNSKAMDAKIKNVKDKIPKGSTYKRSELENLLK